QTLRHVAEHRAQATDIGIHDHAWPGALLVRIEKLGVGDSVGCLYLDLLLDHVSLQGGVRHQPRRWHANFDRRWGRCLTSNYSRAPGLRAGRAMQRASQAVTFFAWEMSIFAHWVMPTTVETLRSATLNFLPTSHSRSLR